MSIEFSNLIPKRTNRVFICGRSGSGKTTLAQMLLATRHNVFIIDTKLTMRWRGYERFSKLADFIASNARRKIYQPRMEEIDNSEFWNAFYKYAFAWVRRTNQRVTVYTDESSQVTFKNQLTPYHRATMKQGRELGIESWNGTQRPIDVPQDLMSEAEESYVFRLKLQQDREKVEDQTGLNEARIARLKKRQFYYINDDEDYISPVLTLNL
jgi:energy-coupling factor transporter ATP-binding protein EcfA2